MNTLITAWVQRTGLGASLYVRYVIAHYRLLSSKLIFMVMINVNAYSIERNKRFCASATMVDLPIPIGLTEL